MTPNLPRLDDVNLFVPWMREAARGARCVYFEGEIASAAELDRNVELLRDTARAAAELGTICLVQAAAPAGAGADPGARRFRYIAVKR